ncbi:MAG: hypothetical protein IKA85_05180 [Clostridia bacterium]|nr:hypothetical protein [Clostridia bacterium]
MSKILYPVGVIDVGSNSVRLMFTDGVFSFKNLIITRLGGGFLPDGSLSINSMATTANAIKKLKDLALSKGAKSVFVFATAATRKATNKDEFISLVKDIAGLELDVVPGELEAELAVRGALKNDSGAVIDIGGASSEIAFSKNGEIYYKISYNVGAVTLNTAFNRNREEIEKYLDGFIADKVGLYESNVKSVGGTATSIGAVSLNLKEYDATLVNNRYVSKEDLIKIIDVLYSLTPDEISSSYAVPLKRADVIAGGASILLRLLNAYNLDGFTVSESDNLEGYLDLILTKK